MSSKLSLLKQHIQDRPNDAFGRFAIAMEYVKLDMGDEALQAFEQLLTDHPSYTGTYYHFVDFLMKRNEAQRATEVYQQGVMICKEQNAGHDLNELMMLGEDYFDLD